MRESLLRMHSSRQWGVLAVVMIGIVTLPLILADHHVPLLGKFLCLALLALSLDLVWGYTGILSLGHTVFFAAGGYCMGMYLMRAIAGEGVYKSELPDFMVFLDWKELPWTWQGFDQLWFAVLMALVVPGLLAFVFGFFAFRSRSRGVYFSIITQALTYALMLLMFRNETGFGGNNGLTDFKRLAGYSLHEPATKIGLYVASAIALLMGYLVCRFVVTSRLGRVLVAIRDREARVRFLGYAPLRHKLFVWTLSAVLAGLAGALYAPQVGIINPSELHPAAAIEIAIWVAVGGRGTLLGAIGGAFLVNGAKSWLTAAYPNAWLYALGGLFVIVTRFFPQGLLRALAERLGKLRRPGLPRPDEASPADEARAADEAVPS